MLELIARRNNGDQFEFENFIDEEVNKIYSINKSLDKSKQKEDLTKVVEQIKVGIKSVLGDKGRK